MSVSIIVAFITGVLGPILLLFIKNKLEKKQEKPDMVLETLKVSELVMTKLDHIKEEFKGDRVWVAEFCH
jgi:capsular polysaccharide biosynthesis protein